MDEDNKTQITIKIPSKKLLNNNEKSTTNLKDDKLTNSRKEEKLNRRDHNHRNRDDKLKDEKEDEKKRWKLKFEQIQTQLSRTEIQMYDYKEKLNDLIKENLNLKENLENKIQQLEHKLTNKNSEYLNLNDQYNKLKNKLLNDEESIDFNQLLIDNQNDNNQNDNNQNNKLNQIKKLIETNKSLKELNEQLRNEIKNLENELEESSDKYREDQSNEFKDLKFKLENTVKNNRLLQFKLTKLERAYNQIKVENHHLTNKLKKATELSNLRNRPLTPQTTNKEELDKCKEILLRMHISLQTLKGEKKQLEDQLNLTKSELLAMSLRNQQQQQQLNKSTNRAFSPQSSIDNKHLEEKILDLEERESDLQEQLKFSEQESKSLRKKILDLEERESDLQEQIQNLCNTNDEISKDNSIERIVASQDEKLIQLKKQLEDEKSKNEELEKKLQELKESKEFIRRGSGELIRRDSGEIIRRSSNDFNREQNRKEFNSIDDDDQQQKTRSTSNISLNAFNISKVDKVLQKENFKSNNLFYEEKIENLERQLQKMKNDFNEKLQENENLMNLIDLKRKDKLGKRSSMIRSASLDEN